MKLEELMALNAEEFVVFDTETTNFKATLPYGKIVEIGAVKVRNGEIVDTFSEFINPEMKIPKKIVELTGITDNDVKDADTIYPVLRRFREFCGKAVLVAHNAPFDIRFIGFYTNQILQPLLTHNVVLDTVKMDKELFPDENCHKLAAIAERLDITQEAAHRAIDDARVTALAFIKMREMLKEKIATFDYAYTTDVINIDVSLLKFRNMGDFKKEATKTRQELDRLYVTVYYSPTNTYGSIYYDRIRKSWYNKDLPENYCLDFNKVEEEILKIRKGVL